jgi:RNA polymerase sigma-70 factor, ECF subfamily
MEPTAVDDVTVDVEAASTSFETCFRQHYPRLVRSLGAGDDGAEEAVQEAFVQAHLRWRRVSKLDDPVGWIRRVAIRRILNQNRSLLRRDRAVVRLAARPGSVEHHDPVVDGSIDELRDAVRGLPVRQRMALVLHHLDGLPIKQVADAMEVSEGTVKSQLHDARTNLRHLLEVDDD